MTSYVDTAIHSDMVLTVNEKLTETIKWLRSQAAEFTAAADALERASGGRTNSAALEARTRECITQEILGLLESKRREGKSIRAGDIAKGLMLAEGVVAEIIREHEGMLEVGDKGWIRFRNMTPITTQIVR